MAYDRHGRQRLLCSVSGAGILGQAELLGGQPDPEVGGRERVGVAEAAHGDHLRGPRSDARQRQQLFAGAVPVAAGVEHDVAVGQRPDRATTSDRCRDFGKAR